MNIDIGSAKVFIENAAIALSTALPTKAISSVPDFTPKVNLVDYESIFNNNDNTFSSLKQILPFTKYKV